MKRTHRQQRQAERIPNRPWGRKALAWVLVSLAATAAVTMLVRPRTQPVLAEVPKQGPIEDYVTADTCQECHADEHSSWHSSFHRTMTQVVSADNVQALFDDVDLESRERPVHLSKTSDGKFWCEMVDMEWDHLQSYGFGSEMEDPPRVKREVVMSTGSHHYQTYWVNSSLGNQLYQIPWVFLIDDQRWVPAEDAFIAPPDGPRKIGVWNFNCIQCHTVGGQPGFDPQSGIYQSQVADFGIACEACHGPGLEHVTFHRQQTGAIHAENKQADATIVNPARLPHDRSSEVCGQCHANFRHRNDYKIDGNAYRPGDDISLTRRLLSYEDPQVANDAQLRTGYWPDGTMRLAGRDFTALSGSACYQQGEISCLSCHAMHSFDSPEDQLIAHIDDNESCLQCHESMRDDISAHTHHTPTSSGSKCYNCHMPHTSFGLLKAIRSHRIDSPSARLASETGRPNACNLCHLDKPLAWTADRLTAWYGHESLDGKAPSTQTSASLLQLLTGDAAQRAVVAWSFGWEEAIHASGNHWQVPFLARMLEDPYTGVRYVAHKSLVHFPGFEEFEFDFLCSPPEREVARKKVVQTWLNSRPKDMNWKGNTVLLNDDGTLPTSVIEQLISQRDNNPVYLPE